MISRELLKSKLKVSALHVLCSALVLLIFSLVIIFIWYPGFYFEFERVDVILKIIIMADVILGPLLMFILFVPGKKGMVFDIVCILVMQLAFFSYGVFAFSEGRPRVISFYEGSFYLASYQVTKTVGLEKILKNFDGDYPKVVFVKLPDDPFQRNEIFKGVFQGASVRYRPELQENFQSNLTEALTYSLDVRKSEAGAQALEEWLLEHGGRYEDYAWFPLLSGNRSAVIVLDRNDGKVLGVL